MSRNDNIMERDIAHEWLLNREHHRVVVIPQKAIEAGESSSASPLVFYRRRFWILFAYTMLGIWQSVVWITFSPIDAATKRFFPGTSDFYVDLLLNLGCMVYPPVMIVGTWVSQRQGGLRLSTVIAAFFLLAGSLVRCLALIDPAARFALPSLIIGRQRIPTNGKGRRDGKCSTVLLHSFSLTSF
jgi:hypothetical protein